MLPELKFTASDQIIPAFKFVSGRAVNLKYLAFNAFLIRPRVKSEHCIGLLKGIIDYRKNILCNQGYIDNAPISEFVRVCMILHNMLIYDSYHEE